MSLRDYITVRSLKLSEIPSNEHYKRLVRQYAQTYCSGQQHRALMRLAA